MFKSIPSLRIHGTAADPFIDDVMVEIPLRLIVNDTIITTAMTSPVELPEFVTGFLFTGGIIGAISDIRGMRIEGNDARVEVRKKDSNPAETGIIAENSFRVHPDTIRNGLFEVLESDLHNRTGGAQTVGLVTPPHVTYRAEDIGRHNALDRVIGFGLLNGIDPGKTFIVCSGRISAAMAGKCIKAGIPLAATRGATTTEAIRIADEGGLSIVGFVRRESMNVYTGRHRIITTE